MCTCVYGCVWVCTGVSTCITSSALFPLHFIKTHDTETNTDTHFTVTCVMCVTYLCLWMLPLCHCLSVTVCVCLPVNACVCVCVDVHGNLLQIASASSDPSAHSGSPSQRHLEGTHCPFLQAKSVVAHVFFAAETQKNNDITLRIKGRKQALCVKHSTERLFIRC